MYQFFFFLLCSVFVFCSEPTSITGANPSYVEICDRASRNDVDFMTFRRDPVYIEAVEGTIPVRLFWDYLHKNHPEALLSFGKFSPIDQLGSPHLNNLTKDHKISNSLLRYLCFGYEILSLFDLPTNPSIVEIGGGFGGQCLVIDQLLPFESYTIIDLPEATALTKRFTSHFSTHPIHLYPHTSYPDDIHYDLLISSYAFSECSREQQIDYFIRVIRFADRGFILFNQCSDYYGIDSLSLTEFVDLLKSENFSVSIQPELIRTHSDNYLVRWTR